MTPRFGQMPSSRLDLHAVEMRAAAGIGDGVIHRRIIGGLHPVRDRQPAHEIGGIEAGAFPSFLRYAVPNATLQYESASTLSDKPA